ncbi:NAD(P)/FAD-dependent oxidoreductase [Conexibacter arvalis]|uniref:3-phenylpropionate/trans-cinnamate dioxygenase ferredoxin reductase subunit n=1 Tax=Conexibacter arvalis TaxID=912552 RepID=A0A840IC70_9ACTN|nr:FAD-dependent oxidoreductase [Conexibacter arvalis]MBB4661813.1 3-phenylpropionate/trans-cinnamate dioxygenase ferredoxin reductase subunit [Conexibacter arvalis]
MSALDRILVVGASLAGLRAAERLRADGFEGTLTVLGDEPHAPYDRPPLSKELLAGTRTAADVAFPVAPELGVEWVLGDAAVGLDLDRRVVATAAGEQLAFDGLVIATGSGPRRLPAFDLELPNVFELRTLDDAAGLRAALTANARPHLLIVGSGFIGVEVAATARELGAEVTIVSLDPPLKVAGELVSSVCAEMLADHGVRTIVGHGVASTVESDGRLAAVVLDDGRRIEADLCVVAAGAVPATGWLEGSGLTLDNGVLCDASLAAVGAERVVAAGDVARWPNPLLEGMPMRIEHWTNAVEGGAAAARTLLQGPGAETEYGTVPGFWSDHFGIRLQSVGLPVLADRFEVVDGSVAERRFAAAAYRGDLLVGCISYANPRTLVQYRLRLARGGFMQPAPVA